MGKQGLALARKLDHVLPYSVFLYHDHRRRYNPTGSALCSVRVHGVPEQHGLGERWCCVVSRNVDLCLYSSWYDPHSKEPARRLR